MKKAIAIILVLTPVIAVAQMAAPSDGESYVRKTDFSLFDPSRLTMHNSYTFSYYSGSGRSGTIGYYMNSIEYAFSGPLKIRLDLGYLHNPTSMFSRGSSGANTGAFVPGISVDWRPSDQFCSRYIRRLEAERSIQVQTGLPSGSVRILWWSGYQPLHSGGLPLKTSPYGVAFGFHPY
jgi:hypothetical protein